MKCAIVSLSFDDGRGDNRDIFENVLIPRTLPATLNVTTGYVDGSCPEELSPSDKQAITVSDVQKFANTTLVEIALHGNNHLNTEEDIAAGRNKVISWLDLQQNHVFGFASPGSGLKVDDFLNSQSPLFREHISYLRTSLRIEHYKLLRILSRKAGRIMHIPLLYQIAYADTLMSECADRVVYSVPVMKDTTLSQVKALINLAVRRRCGLTLMFHSIVDDMAGEDNWSWERQKFIGLCDYLDKKRQEGMLEVLTTQQLVDALRR